MFKSLNRTCVAVCLLLIGTCSSVFAIDFSQALSQAEGQSQWIETLFQWKAQVSNLYKKALKLSKDREVVATTTSLDQLKEYYNDCSRIKNNDFVNILYNSNSSFKLTFEALLSNKTKSPTTDEISKSYDNFYACKGIGKSHTAADKQAVDNEVQNVYYEWYSNAFSISTLNQDNFWADLLRNGATDDGDFDLLNDINQIGKTLFEGFNDSPQVLFYRLPEEGSSLTQWWGDLSSLYDQSSYQLWGGWWSSAWTITPAWWSPSSDIQPSLGVVSLQQPQITPIETTTTSPSDDKEIQAFIESTNPTTSTTPGVALLLWNQCLSWDTSVPVVEEKPLMDPEKYIAGIVDFINTPNVDTLVYNYLKDKARQTNPLPVWWSTSDPWYAQTVANSYAEQAFGEAAPGTCAYACKDMSLDQQAQCELECAGSCIKQCIDKTKLNVSACSTNYAYKVVACNDQSPGSISTCNTNYINEKNACSSFSTSYCTTNYTNTINSCDTLVTAKKIACKANAELERAACITSNPINIAQCEASALTNKTSCLTNITLSPAKKAACKVATVAWQASCIKQTVTDLRLCVSDCTCFLIAGPNWVGWKKMEDMFSIKFCKVPVEKTAVKPWKKVFSIQAIFQEISDVLEWLRDSGQTTKFSKKKEFLDSNIKINFADNFAFKLQVNFKPLFPKKSAATKEKEQQQDMRDFSLWIMNMNVGSPTADDPNKYIVISDPVRNDATMEEATSLGDIQQNIANFTAAAEAAKKAEIPSSVLTDLKKAYVNKTPIAFVQNMISFLEDNQTFRQNTSEALSDMTKMSNELKLKIDSSK